MVPFNNMEHLINYLLVGVTVSLLITAEPQDARATGVGVKNLLLDLWESSFHPYKRSREPLQMLTESAMLGNIDSQGYLQLFNLLGIDKEPNLAEVESKSLALAQQGLKGISSTIIGFLMRHNLSHFEFSKEDLEVFPTAMDIITSNTINPTESLSEPLNNKALEHFINAANVGEPLAQIILGEHFRSTRRCLNATDMYRKSALQTLRVVDDGMMARFRYEPYILPEDGPAIQFPTIDHYHFLEYEANLGDADSALNVALLLLSEDYRVPYDPEKAQKYLKIAIEAKSTTAMVYMADLHVRSKVPQPDFQYARELLEEALELKDYSANAVYARLYLEGLGGLPRDHNIAASYLTKALKESRTVDSMYLMGQNLVSFDPTGMKSLEYWQIPAAYGHVFSAWYVAELYMKEIYSYKETAVKLTTDITEQMCQIALPYYRMVAQSGGWHNLLFAAYKDFNEGRFNAAAVKYMLLSDLGFEVAHVNLGRLLQLTEPTIFNQKTSIDKEEYRAWHRASKEQNPLGYIHLGHHHYYGTGGLEKSDKVQAALNYQKAKFLEHPEAAFNMGYMYEWGEGVQQSIKEAIKNYNFSINLSEDSLLPATLALQRLYFYQIVNITLAIDLYTISYDEFLTSFYNFVLLPETALFFLIVILLYYRR